MTGTDRGAETRHDARAGATCDPARTAAHRGAAHPHGKQLLKQKYHEDGQKQDTKEGGAMTTDIGKVLPNKRYSPTQAARILGMDYTTLWRKTRSGQIRCATRSADGSRVYRGLDLIRFFNGEE